MYEKTSDPVSNKPGVIYVDMGRMIAEVFSYCCRFWWLVLGCAAAGILAVHVIYTVTYQPCYRSQTTFTVSVGAETGTSAYYFSYNTADQISTTFPYILDSHYFNSLLLEEIGRSDMNGELSASALEESNVVTMTMTSPDPNDAYEFLISAVEVFPEAARFVLGQIRFDFIGKAEIPAQPCNLLPLSRQALYGAGGGLLILVSIFFLIALLNRKVSSREALKPYTNMKCLSYIPEVPSAAHRKKKGRTVPMDDHRIRTEYSNSIRTLSMRLQRELRKNKGQTILLTGTGAGEGATTLAVELAVCMADQGSKVLLIDGNLHEENACGKLLGVGAIPGIRNICRGEIRTDKILVRTGRENLSLLSNGEQSNENTSALLSNALFRQWITDMKEYYDYIVIDGPACGCYQDSQLLSDYADGVLYVIKYGSVSINQIRYGLRLMDRGSAPMLGYAFNCCPGGMGNYSYGMYGYHYGHEKYGR
ncbi:MAG: AAA family ATPase [Lachnospiraceae bacterium]|nr:AAA family ATPase [Lachnospiraceae bacterium]